MTDEYLRVVLNEIKDDLLMWNMGKDFDEWSDIIKKINLLLKQIKKE
jgi:hypothetical protein